MLAFAQANPEMNRFLLIKFINRYLNQKYMWEDAIFVHLYEKYLSNKTYPWLDEKGKKLVQDRAYSLMANILGTPASDILLPNVKGQIQSLYSVNAPYTLVVFWDPTCGHCKETLPRVDSIYFKKWRGLGLQVYSVAKETSGSITDWFDFINKNQLNSWVNVYYSKSQEQSMVEDGRPGYSQLYDIVTFPTIYLLDSAKRIKAKKLSIEQIDELLSVLSPE
jgi:thiol-disulfide isomerase/thioredoxin